MKKILFLVAVAGVGFFLARKTNVCSYAETIVSQVTSETKRQIPNKFELERIRHEIASLDRDVSRMIRPVAEYKTDIDLLRQDMARSQAKLDERRLLLLGMTEDVRSNPQFINYDGRNYPVEQIRRKLQQDFASFKASEKHAQTQRQLLEAKEASLKGTQEQLAKVVAKKREYELRLAQLEAEEETLQVARIGNKLQLDDSRATQIEASLAEMEKRHLVERTEIELKSGSLVSENIPVQQRGPVDAQAIRDYLQRETPAIPRDETANTK